MVVAALGVAPVVAAASTIAPVVSWAQQAPATSPPSRDGASMAYDPAIGAMVLFGGSDSSASVLNDTWTYNGTTWTEQSPATSPPARYGASMAYDPAIGAMVLFGGTDSSGNFLNDTWTYNGTTWTQQSPTASPPAAYTASMAYDPATAAMVLFGGLTNLGLSNQTWTYSGTTWTQQSPTASPPSRFEASMAYDPATAAMVLFGGYGGTGGVLGDTWTYDGTTWTQQSPATSPPARDFASMGYDPATAQMVLFGGGANGTVLGDTWTYSGSTWTEQSPATSPSARDFAAMAYDPAIGQMVLFGGLDSSGLVLNDTWTYGYPPGTTDSWLSQSPTTSPPARDAAAMAYDPATGEMVLFGGLGSSGLPVGDTWIYSGTTWTQQFPTTSPPARESASMAYDPATGEMVLFGGLAGTNGELADTWTYNGTTWTQQTPATSPPARYGASMAFDPATGQMVLFGGTNGIGSFLADTWTYNGTTWTQQTPATSPSAREAASMAYDRTTGEMVLFGGYGSNGLLRDTWSYNGTSWVQQSPPTSPSARQSASMAYDPAVGALVLFGGDNSFSTYYGDTWTYDGTNWTEQSPATSPQARASASMAYDPATGAMVLFGGQNSSATLGDTWAYQAVATVASAPTGVAGTSGANGQSVVTWNAPASDGGSPITGYTVEYSTAIGGPYGVASMCTDVNALTCTVTGLTNGTSYYFEVEAINAVGTGPLSSPSSAVTPAAPLKEGTYAPVTPIRVTDTRAGSGLPNAGSPLGTGGTLNVAVAGTAANDGVPADALAVVVNVTAVDPSAAGFFTVYPTGTAQPVVSNLNFVAGETTANLATIPVGANGDITIFNHFGTVNALVDVYGYYTATPSTTGAGLYDAVSPYRAAGTLQSGVSVASNSTLPVTVVGGSTGVPASATSVVVNLTEAGATAPSFLTAYAAGSSRPTVSNLNFTSGEVRCNRAVVAIGTGGQIEVYNHYGSVKVDVDIDGYYTAAGGTGSVFVPMTPVRVTDTRVPTNGTPIRPDSTETFNLVTSSLPASASAVAANFTIISGDASGYATVYPVADTTRPVASDVNWTANEVVPNFTIADTAGSGKIDVFASQGDTVNLAIDVFGYFTAPVP